jgi:NitT/TauT family transport system substrate-binding protein
MRKAGPTVQTQSTLSRRQFGAIGALTALSTLAVDGCTADEPRRSAPSLDAVTYLTGFGAAGRESYAWVAEAKGFFAEQGLKVTIALGAAGDVNNELIAADKAQFAAVDASGAFVRYAKGLAGTATALNTSFQIVCAVQQSTLISLIALQRSGIRAPHDLQGRTVVGATGAAPQKLFPAYAKLAHFDDTRVAWKTVQPNQISPLVVSGKADAGALFVVAEPGLRKAAHGAETVVLPYKRYMPDLFGTVLVTQKKLIAQKPDLVRRFTGALLKGLAYAIEHPAEAAAILVQAQPSQDRAIAAQEVTLMKPYVLPQDAGAVIGTMNPKQVDGTISLLQSVSLIKPGITAGDIVNDGFLGLAPKR